MGPVGKPAGQQAGPGSCWPLLRVLWGNLLWSLQPGGPVSLSRCHCRVGWKLETCPSVVRGVCGDGVGVREGWGGGSGQ